MNPLSWKREHQIAWLLTILLGVMLGLLWGLHSFPEDKWIEFYLDMTNPAFVGDPTGTGERIRAEEWSLLWPGTVAGGGVGAIAFYTGMLLRA